MNSRQATTGHGLARRSGGRSGAVRYGPVHAPAPVLEPDVAFAGLTTLGVGGPARYLAQPRSVPELIGVLALARRRGLAVFVLGGGSNLLVSDAGFDGLVIRYGGAQLSLEPMSGGSSKTGEMLRVQAGAGLSWDRLVARTVAAGVGGIECLSGIPGAVGGAPIQNIGAYGQEVSEHLTAVHVIECASGRARCLSAVDCEFGYRRSRFQHEWRGRYVVTGVELQLPRTTRATLRYDALIQRFASASPPTPAAVREAVLAIRRDKSMLLEPGDPNRRSAGSFFVNPQVPAGEAERLAKGARTQSVVGPPPRHVQANGRVKLSAAWLIEAAGFRRGTRRGRVGLSSRHALALINLGGATATELLGFAREIRGRVRERFGITLTPEPTLLGFAEDVDSLFD